MRSTQAPWRLVGGCIGLLVAVVWGVAGGALGRPVPAGAEVHVTAAPSGELAVVPSTVLDLDDLRPGRRVVGHLTVRNQTGTTLALVAKGASSSAALLDLIQVQARADGRTVAEGSLATVAAGTAPWPVASGESSDLVLEAWVASGETRHQGAVLDLALHFEARPEAS